MTDATDLIGFVGSTDYNRVMGTIALVVVGVLIVIAIKEAI